MKNFKFFKPGFLTMLFVWAITKLEAQSGIDFDNLTEKTKDQVGQAGGLLAIIFMVIIAIGAIFVGWAFISKKEDANKWLIGLIVAIAIYIIVFKKIIGAALGFDNML